MDILVYKILLLLFALNGDAVKHLDVKLGSKRGR